MKSRGSRRRRHTGEFMFGSASCATSTRSRGTSRRPCRHFGISRSQFYYWRERNQDQGEIGAGRAQNGHRGSALSGRYLKSKR